MIKSEKIELEFIKKKKESEDSYSFYFKWPNKKFNFLPGQYLKIYLDIEKVDERGSSRYFTISSSPEEKKHIIITTRIIKSSFKKKLSSLNKGDRVSAFGPIGYFDYDSKSRLDSVFLAGGVGITPFYSIIKTLESVGKLRFSNIYLFAFFPNKKNIIFYDELKKREKKNNHLKVVYSLTREVDFNFENSSLSKRLLTKHIKNYDDARYFIAGSERSVESMNKTLIKIGIPQENIFKEDFSGY